MIIAIVFAALLLFFALLPAIILAYFYASKRTACPFCGETKWKSEKECPHCSRSMPDKDDTDEKITKVGRKYGEGANLRGKPGEEKRRLERVGKDG